MTTDTIDLTTCEWVTVKVGASQRGKDFTKAVAKAKSWSGRYDGATQTWSVPAPFWANRLPCGLVEVKAAPVSAACQQYTTDQGCPLHGETCTGNPANRR